MDEAAARRREIRRRKLLLGAEDRLKRIERLKLTQESEGDDIGSCNPTPHDAATRPEMKLQSVESPAPPLGLGLHGVEAKRGSEERLSSKHLHQEETCADPDISHTSCHHPHAQQAAHNSTALNRNYQTQDADPVSVSEERTKPHGEEDCVAATNQSAMAHDGSKDSGFVDGASSQAQSQMQPRTSGSQQETSPQSQDGGSSAQSLVSSRTLVFIILAVVTRLWIVTYLEGQSIIILFCATEGLLSYLGIEQTKTQSSPLRVMTALLTLKGVSAENVQRIQNYMGFLVVAVQDLTTFLFVFITLHAFLNWNSVLDPSVQPGEGPIPQL